MNTITLNFYGEKAIVNLPTTLGHLRNCITNQFLFDPADAEEIVISYVKDFNRTIIKTDAEYKQISALKIKELDLDIAESSKLYQEKKKNAFEEDTKQIVQLEKLRKANDALIEEKNKISNEGKEELEKIQAEIFALRMKHRKKINELMMEINNKNKLVMENEKQIEDLETKLKLPHLEKKAVPVQLFEKNFHRGMKGFGFGFGFGRGCHMNRKRLQRVHPRIPMQTEPNQQNQPQPQQQIPHCHAHANFKNRICQQFGYMKEYALNAQQFTAHLYNNFKKTHFDIEPNKEKPKEKEEPKEEIKQPKTEQKDIVHPHVFCDGCHMFPLKGIRYHCACCKNFDYCAECEEKYSEIHQHPFVCIRDPKMRVNDKQFMNIRKDLPPFDKTIHY